MNGTWMTRLGQQWALTGEERAELKRLRREALAAADRASITFGVFANAAPNVELMKALREEHRKACDEARAKMREFEERAGRVVWRWL